MVIGPRPAGDEPSQVQPSDTDALTGPTLTHGAPAPLSPSPNPVKLPTISAVIGINHLEATMQAIHELEARRLDAWARAAGSSVVNAVLADVKSGALPSPLDDPGCVEQALVSRAMEAACASSYVRHWNTERQFDVFRYSTVCALGPRRSWWVTPLAPYIALRAPLITPSENAPGNGVAGEMEADGSGQAAPTSAVVIRSGSPVRCSALGFDAWLSWSDYVIAVLRDEVLVVVADDSQAKQLLRVHDARDHRTAPYPLRVGAPPAPAVSAPTPTPAPMRKRRTR